MDPVILQCIEHRSAIPSAPQIVTRLAEITNDPNYRVAEVVKLLSTDAGITADILRLANSALFGGSRKIATISDAVVRLGIRQVRSLVVGRALIDALNTVRSPLVDMGYFWRRSLATAVLAARLSERTTRGPHESAFTCGLLCDIGVIILARAVPEKYGPLAEAYPRQRGLDLELRESELLGLTHADVGALAIERWALPEEMSLCIRHHHRAPSKYLPDSTGRLARTLCGSNEIARVLCQEVDPTRTRESCAWAMERIELPQRSLGDVLEQVQTDVSDLSSALFVEGIAPEAFGRITAELSPPDRVSLN